MVSGLVTSPWDQLRICSGEAIEIWMSQHRIGVERTMTMLAEMELGGGLTVAKLSLAGSQVRELAAIAAGRDAR